MDNKILETFINEYVKDFDKIHDAEIYKWKAVKTFQSNWFKTGFENFNKKLYFALSDSRNLLASGNYFPRGVLLEVSEKESQKIEELFNELYDENVYYITRIQNFKKKFKKIHSNIFPNDANHYQDDRAIMVYLSLRYPEKYYLYKYTMFKDFSDRIGLSYKPVRGRIENVSQFMTICELVNQAISQNEDLLYIHKKRLDESMYSDNNFNLLTQDLIYAISRHLNGKSGVLNRSKLNNQKEYEILNLPYEEVDIFDTANSFSGKIGINFDKISKVQKRIGNAGEMFVLKYETEKLSEIGKIPIHTSKIDGDGVGYDIRSYTETGEDKFIEVKTTTGGFESSIFITRNELKRSIELGDKYYLYRVYNFFESDNKGDLAILRGSLESICIYPREYLVKLKK